MASGLRQRSPSMVAALLALLALPSRANTAFFSRELTASTSADDACGRWSCLDYLEDRIRTGNATEAELLEKCCSGQAESVANAVRRRGEQLTQKVCDSLESQAPESTEGIRQKLCSGRTLPLWAWVVIALAVLILLCCVLTCMCRCLCRRKN